MRGRQEDMQEPAAGNTIVGIRGYPQGRVSTLISLWRSPFFGESEQGWLPPVVTHSPVGTYPFVWIGGNHGHSWNSH